MYSILLVDDEPIALEGICAGVHFEALGIDQIYKAYNAAQSMALFAEHNFNIMLCDIEMPGESGLELAQWVNENYPRTVIIFLTCHAKFSYAQDAVRLMAFRYLLKPIRYSDLESILEEAINKQLASSDIHSGIDSGNVVDRMIEYIKNNLHLPFTREGLGKQFFHNPNYLARIFKEQTGQSLFAYITNLRLQRASELLQETSLQVTEICVQIGLEDSSYFAKLFKRQYGVLPRDFRKIKQAKAKTIKG